MKPDAARRPPWDGGLQLVVRTTPDATATLAEQLRVELARADDRNATANLTTMEQNVT